MKKVIALFLVMTIFACACPVYAQDTFNENVSSVQPRDAVLYYTETVVSTDEHMKLDVTYGVDTRNNKIISIDGLSNISSPDGYYSRFTNLSFYSKSISLDQMSADFRVQVYAYDQDNLNGIRYGTFHIAL